MKIEIGDLVRWEAKDGKEIVQGYVKFIESDGYAIIEVASTMKWDSYDKGFSCDRQVRFPLVQCTIIKKGEGK